MAGFVAPIDPAAWTLSLPGPLTIPDGLRYPGLQLPQLRAQRPLPKGDVRVPAAAVLRTVTDNGRHVVEVQVNPFAVRRAAQAVPFGVPTFYLALDDDSDLLILGDGDLAQAGDVIAQATGVGVACGGQDRVARDPALWAAELLDALDPQDRGEWQPFADATRAAAGAQPPVLLLDHRGAPLEAAAVEIASGPVTATARLVPDDGGDLQRTVARMHAADPGAMPLGAVFPPGGGPASLRPQAAGADFQLARLPDAATAAGAIDVTPALRHVALTDLTRWFAPQFATSPVPLARYTRGNVLTPNVNGNEYFDELFHRLLDAGRAGPDGGLHLVGGWQTFPDVELVTRRSDDDPDLPLTLEQAARLIGGAGGATRFLSPQFIQLEPLPPVETVELVAFSVIVMGLLRAKNVDFVRTDAAGAVILLALFVLNLIAVTWIVSENGEPLEPNKNAVDILGAVPNALSRFAPFPAIVDDNPASPPLSGCPFDVVFTVSATSASITRSSRSSAPAPSASATVGGIDINPNRLDDARHLAAGRITTSTPAWRAPRCATSRSPSSSGGRATAAARRWPSRPRPPPTWASPAVTSSRSRAPTSGPPTRAARCRSRRTATARSATRCGEAIARAREFIYIEDQYLTPPADYREALVAKVHDARIRRWWSCVPAIARPAVRRVRAPGPRPAAAAGRRRRGDRAHRLSAPALHVDRQRAARLVGEDAPHAGPGLVRRRRPHRRPRPEAAPAPTAVLGRRRGRTDLRVQRVRSGQSRPRALARLRGRARRRHAPGARRPARARRHRAFPRAHRKGAAATVIDLTGIYVHAKMIIVDDVFVGIGSANLDRRGLFYDGEINCSACRRR